MINIKIKKLLSAVLILLMPTGSMICLAVDNCQEDKIITLPLNFNECNDFNVIQYMSREALDLMCTDTSKRGTAKRIIKGIANTIDWILGRTDKIANAFVAVDKICKIISPKKEKDASSSILLRESMSKETCKELKELSDKNSKSGIIISSRQVIFKDEVVPLLNNTYTVQCPKEA